MNISLAAPSRSWWLPSAVAGGIAVVALGAILILPSDGRPAPNTNAPGAPAVSVPSDHGVGRTCFAERPYGADELPQPACRK